MARLTSLNSVPPTYRSFVFRIQIIQYGLYAGAVNRHNVCKRHVAIDTGFKQTERTIFLHVISIGWTIGLLLSNVYLEKLRQNCQ